MDNNIFKKKISGWDEPMIVCPKCGSVSGDDWSQCDTNATDDTNTITCPMKLSPYFSKKLYWKYVLKYYIWYFGFDKDTILNRILYFTLLIFIGILIYFLYLGVIEFHHLYPNFIENYD